MIITDALTEDLNEVCVRIDAIQHIPATRRLVSTDRDLQDIDDYLAEPIDVLGPIADRRFERVGDGYRDGRYNAAAFPAFYVSRDQASARAEVLHYNPAEKLQKFSVIKLPLYFGISEWTVTGPAENVVASVVREPRLKDNDWPFCQEVGADVRSRVDAVVFPSARLSDGENLAVFKRQRVAGKGRGADIRLDITKAGAVFLD